MGSSLLCWKVTNNASKQKVLVEKLSKQTARRSKSLLLGGGLLGFGCCLLLDLLGLGGSALGSLCDFCSLCLGSSFLGTLRDLGGGRGSWSRGWGSSRSRSDDLGVNLSGSGSLLGGGSLRSLLWCSLLGGSLE